jgi:hypothetical protein
MKATQAIMNAYPEALTQQDNPLQVALETMLETQEKSEDVILSLSTEASFSLSEIIDSLHANCCFFQQPQCLRVKLILMNVWMKHVLERARTNNTVLKVPFKTKVRSRSTSTGRLRCDIRVTAGHVNNSMSSISFELAHWQRWSGLIARCLSHPDEVPLQDELGLTVLHWACINTPTAHVIEALVHHNPTQSICGIKDFNGMTPLHCAFICVADIGVIMTLLRASPPSVLDVDHSRWTCLRYLFSWN